MRWIHWVALTLLAGCLPHETEDGIEDVADVAATEPPAIEVVDGKAALNGRWTFELGPAVAGRVVAVIDAAAPPEAVRLRARDPGGLPVGAKLPAVLVEVTRPEKGGTRVAEMALVAWAAPQPRILWARTSRVVRPDGGGAVVTALTFEGGDEMPSLVLESQVMPGKGDEPFRAGEPTREVYVWNGEAFVLPPGS